MGCLDLPTCREVPRGSSHLPRIRDIVKILSDVENLRGVEGVPRRHRAVWRIVGLAIYLVLFVGIGLLIWHAIDEGAATAPLVGFGAPLLTAIGALILPTPDSGVDQGVEALLRSVAESWKGLCESISRAGEFVGHCVGFAVAAVGIGICTALVMHVAYRHSLW